MSSAETPTKRMTLESVSRGPITKPHRIVVYGMDGVGKTTFAADAPNPIFIGTEMGTAQLDVARFPQPERWSDVLDAIVELGKQEHDYETLVIDTLDWLEPLIFAEVCSRQSVGSIDDVSYGGGYKIAADLWHSLFAYLERLQSRRGMHVILLAHCQIRTFKNPAGEDFDRYEMKLHARAAGLVREWPDEVLFANYQTYTRTDKKKRVRGVSDGSRVIHTTHEAAFDAKNRHGLPGTLPLNWDDFDAACKAGAPASSEELVAAITELRSKADEGLSAKVGDAVKAANGNASKLAKIYDRLKSKIGNAEDGE